MSFKGKVCFITGASSGIGKELANQLAQQGASVILAARSVDKLKEIEQQLPGDNHMSIALDLEQSSNFNDIVKTVLERYAKVDYLFQNGGISQRSEAGETAIKVDRKIMEINYFGNITLTKALLNNLRSNGGGHIVVISSIAGKFGFFLRSAYSAAKHALHGFYESLMLEEEKNNVKVTIACPGKINTDISVNAVDGTGAKHGVMDHNQATGMSVEECVRQLLSAVEKNKKEVLIGNKEIKAVTLKRFFPSLFWKIIKKQSAT